MMYLQVSCILRTKKPMSCMTYCLITVNDRMHANENTHPWEIAVVAYRMDGKDIKEGKDKT